MGSSTVLNGRAFLHLGGREKYRKEVFSQPKTLRIVIIGLRLGYGYVSQLNSFASSYVFSFFSSLFSRVFVFSLSISLLSVPWLSIAFALQLLLLLEFKHQPTHTHTILYVSILFVAHHHHIVRASYSYFHLLATPSCTLLILIFKLMTCLYIVLYLTHLFPPSPKQKYVLGI